MGINIDSYGERLAELYAELRDALGTEDIECDPLGVLLLRLKDVGVGLPRLAPVKMCLRAVAALR